jgi:antitoxin component of RelBE/YafQ-DinJ toxin-antitoxin module
MTKKERVGAYVDSEVKAYAGELARSRGMSLSTLVAYLLSAEVRASMKSGELEAIE